jgi:hypothetical protein
MVRALLSGYHVRELPTTLRTREYGSSKMRIIKETINNFGFVLKIIEYRLFGMKI